MFSMKLYNETIEQANKYFKCLFDHAIETLEALRKQKERIDQIVDALNKTHIPRITALEKAVANQKEVIDPLKNRLNALDVSTYKKMGELEERIQQLESALKQKCATTPTPVSKQETEEISI